VRCRSHTHSIVALAIETLRLSIQPDQMHDLFISLYNIYDCEIWPIPLAAFVQPQLSKVHFSILNVSVVFQQQQWPPAVKLYEIK
jgi:hypothetical protein